MCRMALVIHLAKVFAANCPFALLCAVKLYVINGVLCLRVVYVLLLYLGRGQRKNSTELDNKVNQSINQLGYCWEISGCDILRAHL